MLRAGLLLCCFATLIVGCGSTPEPTAAASIKTSAEEPEKQLYESFRSARYQIDVAGDQLAAAVESAQTLAKGQAEETKQALLEVADNLSKSGSLIADYADELPAYAAFKEKFAEYDDERLEAIAKCDQALKEIQEARETTEDLLASEPPEPERTTLAGISDSIQEAQDGLTEAVKAMKG